MVPNFYFCQNKAKCGATSIAWFMSQVEIISISIAGALDRQLILP
jgi:hypothetical protein